MKVLQLNTFDVVGGAARAAVRLQGGLRAAGIDSRLLVQFKGSAAEEVICTAGPLTKLTRRLKIVLGVLPVRLYPNRPENNFSPSLLPDRVTADVAEVDPDIIHLHWLCAGFLQVETLAKLARLGKPLVWTLHDSWPFTGGCHVPYNCKRYLQSCGACPVLGSSRERDLSRWTWNRKEKAWRDLDLTLVAPSRWLADCAQSSSLFQKNAVEVIPNGLSTEIFRPGEKRKLRAQLGLPQEKKIILFGAMHATSDPNKGFQLLAPALHSVSGRLPDSMALVFGASAAGGLSDLGLPVKFLGRIEDDRRLAACYAAADLFVAPSRQEAFCQTATEALSCGTPVVAFGATGLLDVVKHRESGYLAEPYQVESLAEGITWVLEDPERQAKLSIRARQQAVEEFGVAQMADRYAALYGKLLAKSKNRRTRQKRILRS